MRNTSDGSVTVWGYVLVNMVAPGDHRKAFDEAIARQKLAATEPMELQVDNREP